MLARAGIVDPRAYLWTDGELDSLALVLGLTGAGRGLRRPRLLDLGCGWGSLGIALALRVEDLRVDGIDLDPSMLAAGRRAVSELGLGRRVRLGEGDVADPRESGGADPSAVVCQALLVHQPRPDPWLADVVDRLPAEAMFAAVEVDARARAEGIQDSVTDPDPTFAEERQQIAAAVAEGAQRTLHVDRCLGSRLAPLLRGAGLRDVRAGSLASDQRLVPPYDPAGIRARWFAARLRRRLDAGDDPVDRSLAEAAGMAPERFQAWVARRRDADRRRLVRLGRGEYERDEGAGTFVGWGRVPP